MLRARPFSLKRPRQLTHFVNPRGSLLQPSRLVRPSSSNEQQPTSTSTRWIAAVLSALGITGVTASMDAKTPPQSAFDMVNPLRTVAAHSDDDGNPQPPTTASISRLMLPDEANPAGNVHGGSILQMVDEAGWAAATKYINQTSSGQAVASLARIEKVDFIKPMFIGEMAEVVGTVTFTSKHSIEVKVDVFAENVMTGKRRRTNQARVWYVAKPFVKPKPGVMTSRLVEAFVKDPRKEIPSSQDVACQPALPVPPLQYEDEAELVKGQERYAMQKQQRVDRETADTLHPIEDGDATLIHVLHPSDCHLNGVAQAGSVLKLMDTAAGVVCVRHCRSNVVTASLEAVDFLLPVYNGDLLEVHARPVFNSKRSIDVEVNVYAQSLAKQEKTLAATSIFTFVSLDKNYRVQAVPPLEIETEAQKARFDQGQKRYETRKKLRSSQ